MQLIAQPRAVLAQNHPGQARLVPLPRGFVYRRVPRVIDEREVDALRQQPCTRRHVPTRRGPKRRAAAKVVESVNVNLRMRC